MKTLRAWALLAASVVFVPAPAGAQTAPATGATAAAPTASGQQQNLYRGSRIIGSNVRDPKGKKIGQIKDLVLDGRRGEIAYAVVNFAGVLGVGKKFHPIPWQALAPSEDGKYYILHADQETISQAPGFDKARWPDMADRNWHAEIERYWSRMVGRGNAAGGNNLSSGTGAVSSPADAANQGSGR